MSNDLVIYQQRDLTKEEQLDHIYAEVASGRSLNSVLTNDPNMPSKTMFWGWHRQSEDIQNNLARARETGVEACLEQALDIALTPMEGEETTFEQGTDGVKRRIVRKDMLGHRRLAVDTLIRRAQMIAPRKYGPKLPDEVDQSLSNSIATGIVEGARRLQRAGLTKE